MNTLKQREYARLSICLWLFSVAIITALLGSAFLSVFCTAFGMLFLVLFLDVWLEPEKWRQNQ